MTIPEFVGFPKIARLNRDVVISEKIDGTNAQVYITEEGVIYAGSRTRWITPENDNYGFAAWVQDNELELEKLGPGHHFGEWWGNGIQRRYDLPEKRFSLFNTARWVPDAEARNASEWGKDLNKLIGRAGVLKRTEEILELPSRQTVVVLSPGPTCCHVVPVLYQGPFSQYEVHAAQDLLANYGSLAAPGFRNPEGIVVYHTAANISFKVTLEKDDERKGPQQ